MKHFLEIGGIHVEKPWKTVDINSGDIAVDLNTGRIDVEDSSVNRINCSHLIEHLDYPGIRKFFRDIYRILDNDGIASFVVPNTDSNSWWKGFFEHYDLRMNPFLFRSISKAPESQIIDKHEMWPDYDGHPFGMLMNYSQENFDFEILAIKTFNTKSFSLLNGDVRRYVNLHMYNTVDSYRIFIKKRVPGIEIKKFNYLDHLVNLPKYEFQRDVDYLCTKVRAYLDFSDLAINQSSALIGCKPYMVHQIFHIYSFVDNSEDILKSLCREFDEYLQYPGIMNDTTKQYLKDALKTCEGRKEILHQNKLSSDDSLRQKYKSNVEFNLIETIKKCESRIKIL